MKLLKLVPENTNIDFMRWRNIALILSIIATTASIFYTVYQGLNLGVDFVGGQMVRVSFAQPVDAGQLRGRVDALHLGEANVQSFGSQGFEIRLPTPPGGAAAATAASEQVEHSITAD